MAALASAEEGLLVTESSMQGSAAWRRCLALDPAETEVIEVANVRIAVVVEKCMLVIEKCSFGFRWKIE